jgi:putative copper resistance protein D
MTPESAMASNRFLHDSSLGLLWGGLGYASYVAKGTLAGRLVQRLDPMVSGYVVVAAVTTASGFLISAAEATGERSSILDPETLHLMAETDVGQAFAIQAATAAALVVSTLLKVYRMSVAVTGLMLGELALNGHATEGSGLAGLGHQVTDMVHVLSGTAWLGALVPFVIVLRLSSVLDLRTSAIESLSGSPWQGTSRWHLSSPAGCSTSGSSMGGSGETSLRHMTRSFSSRCWPSV